MRKIEIKQSWVGAKSMDIYKTIRGRPNRGIETVIPENVPKDDLAETVAILNHGGKRLESPSH